MNNENTGNSEMILETPVEGSTKGELQDGEKKKYSQSYKLQGFHVCVTMFLWKYLRQFLGKLHQHFISSPSWKHHSILFFL